jgi:hypothetical protein
MKKFTIIGLAVCLAFALAAPVMAADVDFSGDYRARGFYTEHYDLDKDTASNAYMDMRFRLQTVFKVNDILSVTTRFDAMDDRKWEGKGGTGGVDFDRAYMTIKAPIGSFYVGRMAAAAWGTLFLDSETSMDRIKYVKKIDNLTLYAIFQKNAENDDYFANRKKAYFDAYEAAIDAGATPAQADAAGNAAYAGVRADAADEDSETYYLLGKYKMENVTSGLLLAFTNDKTNANATRHKYTAMPYFVSKFGPLEVQGELAYNWGETDFDAAGVADRDIKELAYNLEATYNFGPASVMAGYAFVSGDDDTDPNEDSAYGSVGADWEKLFILTYDETPVNELGGFFNLSSKDNDVGAKIFYGGATFSPLDNLELGVVVGSADADEVPAGVEDDFGIEYDLTLNWKIYDNLTYTAIAAFLDAGDIWKAGFADVEIEDTYALFHQLELSF